MSLLERVTTLVRANINDMLDRLPPAFTPNVYEQACERAYLHVYDTYYGEGRSLYAAPPPRAPYGP